MKTDLTKNLIDEIYFPPPEKIYPTNKITYNHIDAVWSTDLADMIDFKTSNRKRFRFVFVIIDMFSKNIWCIPLQKQPNKNR